MTNNANKRILVVDDEPLLRDVLTRAMTRLGHECRTAANGKEAVALFAARSFDLVLTDRKMPGMGGLARVEWLRARRPQVPVIIMTGFGDLESARKALRLRVSDYLVKPFENLTELTDAVTRALENDAPRADAGRLVDEFEKRARAFDERERHLTGRLERAQVELRSLAGRIEHAEAVSLGQVGRIGELIEDLDHGMLVTDAAGTGLSRTPELRRQIQAAGYHGAGAAVERLPGDPALREAIVESIKRVAKGEDDPTYAQTGDGSEDGCLFEVRSAPIASRGNGQAGVLTTVRPSRLKKTTPRWVRQGPRAARARVAPWGKAVPTG